MKYIYRLGAVSVSVYDQKEACQRLGIHWRQLTRYVNYGLLCSFSAPGFGSLDHPGLIAVYPCEEIDWISLERVVFPYRSVLSILKDRKALSGLLYELRRDEE